MNIGVLGGSFDPPHIGHYFVAKTLLKHKLCQKIILVPCFKHPFSKPLTEATHRLAMTKMLEGKDIEVSDIEVKRGNISYTVDTLKALKAQFPKDDFSWIIGMDQVKDFKKWKGWREIIEKFGLIVVSRRKNPPRGSPTATPEVIERIPAPPRWPNGLLGGESQKVVDVSSSEIRRKVRGGKNIDGLVPEKVERYIIQHNLYL